MEPNVPQQGIVPTLVQKQLPVASQSRIDLAVLVEIRRKSPAACMTVEIEYSALSDVDE